MSEDAMLVRMPGGDVVRRPVAYAIQHRDLSGRPVGAPVREPELREDETFYQAMGDPIPLIIKTQ